MSARDGSAFSVIVGGPRGVPRASVRILRFLNPASGRQTCREAGRSGLDQAAPKLFDVLEGAATPGKIAVHTRCEFDQVLVSIEDNGTGIPPENLPHLFEPFFTTKAPGKGTGLGLDISHRIVVDHHHGDLQVRSEPGMTRFEVRLPTRLAE